MRLMAPGSVHVETALSLARLVRMNMSGSICGLPCYVPRTRFCLVHNTIGGLQLAGNADGPQRQRYPQGVPVCSRKLTRREKKAVGFVENKLAKDARLAALRDYGARVSWWSRIKALFGR